MNICLLCGEEIAPEEMFTAADIYEYQGGPRKMHQECAVREVVGGIGHLVAHDHWCQRQHDPDAGLTYRQSALLVYQWVAIMGADAAAERGSISS